MTAYEVLSSFLPKSRLITEEPMSKHSTFKIGGPAEIFTSPEASYELLQIIRACKKTETKFFIIGGGADLLFADAGFRGVIIKTSNIKSFEISREKLTADAGARLIKISDAACKAGLSGLEFACGIPGTVGGAVYMNAGAYGHSVSDVCESVEIYFSDKDEVKTYSGAEMKFDYRKSVLQSEKNAVVLSAGFKLSRGDSNEIRAETDELLAKRKASQPLEFPSAGSVFKRPPGNFAGKLIQDSGLTGYSIGGAQISEKHAGFIVNKGGAAADDVLRLIEHIQKTVLKKFGVSLETEIKYIC